MLTAAQAVAYLAERGVVMGPHNLKYHARRGNIASIRVQGRGKPHRFTTEALDTFLAYRNRERTPKRNIKRNVGGVTRKEYMQEYNNLPDVKQRRRNYEARNKRKTLHQQRVRRKRKNPEYTDSILHLLAVLDEITGDKYE